MLNTVAATEEMHRISTYNSILHAVVMNVDNMDLARQHKSMFIYICTVENVTKHIYNSFTKDTTAQIKRKGSAATVEGYKEKLYD